MKHINLQDSDFARKWLCCHLISSVQKPMSACWQDHELSGGGQSGETLSYVIY